MNKYDAIVIGAGNGGLVSALRLAKNNLKVLVLEKENLPGGFATSFIRGRFEFEASLQELYEFGSISNQGSIYRLFKELDCLDKMDFVEIPEAYHVFLRDSKEDYLMPYGIEEYIEKMEEYVSGSKESLSQFFNLARECRQAMIYLEKNQYVFKEEELKDNYPNFMLVANLSVSKVLNSLSIPLKAQEILTANWTDFGSPTNTLSFVHFASMFYSYISKEAKIPKKTSHEISLVLSEEIINNGGEIKYLSEVNKILFENDKIMGVELKNGDKFFANHLICDISPNIVYGQMIPKQYLNKKAIKLTSSRVLGARGFAVYLGLNQSAYKIGLDNYNYIITKCLNSNKEYYNMSKLAHGNSTAIVINNANPTCSPKGTCIMNFTSMFFGDCFDEAVNEKNYFKLKEQIASYIITAFEEATGIIIKPYIEEIEIATPVTFARYGGHPHGVIYGFKPTGLDNIIPRLINESNENYLKNLRFCGGFSACGSGFSSTYLSGDIAAIKTLEDMKVS